MHELKNKIGEYKFVAQPFDVDFMGRLTMGVLGNHLLNVAGFHAAHRGFGISELNERYYTWVLSRLAIEMKQFPMKDEEFIIQTWVENVYRLFTDRNFAILNKKREPLGYARSVWAMIDMESRKPIDLIAMHEGKIAEYITDKACPIAKPVRVKVQSIEPVAKMVSKYSDIDINGHVNSIKYIEHILDIFPMDIFKRKKVKRFEMAYVAESYYNEALSFYCDKVGDDEYNIEVKKNGDETMVRSKVIFV